MSTEEHPFGEGVEVIELSRPIKVGQEEVTKITLREPSMGDFAALEDLEIGIAMKEDSDKYEIKIGKVMHLIPKIISRLSGLPLEAISEIRAADLSKMGGRLISFFGDYLTDGKTPSD